MNKLLTFTVTICLLIAVSLVAIASDTIEAPEDCKYCGMDRTKFAHSRMLVTYGDGSTAGTCSLHCTAVELANNIDKNPTAIKVGDFNSKQLVDAETAFWVIGGSRMGVMTSRAKWAFSEKSAAETFIKANQGNLASFDDAIRTAYEDMYKDTKMIRDRRAAKRTKHHH